MRSIKILLIFISFIFLSVNFSEAQTKKTNKSKAKKPVKLKPFDERGCPLQSYSMIGNKVVTAHYYCPADITKLNLSRTEVLADCEEKPCSDAARTIDVLVEATDPEGFVLVYNYTISGGKILGSGSSVKWDLSGVNPGTYTITAAVDDGCGFCGKTMTKVVKVIRCPDCQ